MTATKWTLPELIHDLGLTMTIRRANSNPNMAGNMNHWSCTLKWPEAPKSEWMTVRYSQGLGIGHDPMIDDVLSCLALDADGIESSRNFTDWCNEYGYDTDSRTAERIYKACKRQTDKLREFLGNQYDTLLWETEVA